MYRQWTEPPEFVEARRALKEARQSRKSGCMWVCPLPNRGLLGDPPSLDETASQNRVDDMTTVTRKLMSEVYAMAPKERDAVLVVLKREFGTPPWPTN